MNRWHVLIPALAGSLGLVIFSDQPTTSTAVVSAVPARAPNSEVARPSPGGDRGPGQTLPMLIDRATLYPSGKAATRRRDLFAGHDWTLVSVQTTDAETTAPDPPAFPFTYLGKKWEAGTWEVFLAKDEATLVLKEGQVAEHSFRVVKIAPPVLTMVYVPMNHEYSVPIGDAE